MDEPAIPPLLGIIGHPIAGNPMQFAMEQALSVAQLDWRFLSFDVSPARLADAVAGVHALGFRGLAVAPPHGAAMLELVEQQSDTARATGWADTLSRAGDGSLVAHHFAGEALVQLVYPELLQGSAIALLGDAPQSVAIFAALIAHHPRALLLRETDPDRFAPAIEKATRNPAAGQEAAIQQTGEAATPQFLSWNDSPEDALPDVRVLVRGATPAGVAGEAAVSEAHIARLHEECVVVDLAICASTSPLLRTAAARSLRTFSLIDLLVTQTALAFNQWTGREVDQTALQEAFEEYLEI